MGYELCLELIRRLETIKRYQLCNSRIVTILADLVYKYDIRDLELLNNVAESLLSINFEKPEYADFVITPQEILRAEIAEKDIAPLVCDIRREVFGSEDVPFSGRESALDWLNKYALSDVEAIQEYKKVIDSSMKGDETFSLVVAEHMIFLPDSPPAILYKETENISNKTGVEHISLFWHVLANSKLFLPKYLLSTGEEQRRLPSGRWTNVKQVILRFRGTINFEDMREIYEIIKASYKFGKVKQINAKHLELYRLVNKEEVPQKKGKVAFWKKIMEEWNRTHPKAKYSTWKGVSVAYTRILKSIDLGLRGQEKEPSFGELAEQVSKEYLGSQQREVKQNERSHSQEV